MARMDRNGSDTVTLEIGPFLGQNTAVQFSQIGINQSPRMLNLLPGLVGALRHRPGTKLVTQTPRVGGLKRIFPYRKAGALSLVASGGTTLYKFDSVGLDWDAQTMTDALLTDNINAVQYRDDNANEVLVIADGGNLKAYDGTAVENIAPAADDTSPLPKNALSDINTNNPAVGVTIHNNRLVIWPNQKDIIFHSKPGFYDYFPQTSYQRFVRDNDYIQTCISFGSSLLVFLRHSIGALFGDGYSETPEATDWSQDFLDTTEGCVNPRSVQIVVFPNGQEEVFYQTDRGVSSVQNIDTKSLDNSTRFATRSVTESKIDWNALGVTNTEWASAVSYFTEGKYWLIYTKGGQYNGLVYDTDTGEWFPINNILATDFYADEDGFRFIGTSGHLKIFDDNIHFDYTNFAQTVGTPVAWEWYSKLMNPVMTGFNHLWDILMVEAKQWNKPSSIDVEVNGYKGQTVYPSVLKTEIMIVGLSIIGQAQIANNDLTDIINNAKRLRIFIKSQYAQIKLSSNRGEPVELYQIRFEVRPQLTYS